MRVVPPVLAAIFRKPNIRIDSPVLIGDCKINLPDVAPLENSPREQSLLDETIIAAEILCNPPEWNR